MLSDAQRRIDSQTSCNVELIAKPAATTMNMAWEAGKDEARGQQQRGQTRYKR